MFGYAGNIVFYNIVSVSIDVIAYERIQAENCDAEILFGYAGNIVFYNIVSVSIDMIAYERINAENCSMKERYVR